MRSAVADSVEGKQFLTRLQGNTFRQRLAAMPGYEPLPVRAPGAWAEFLT
jgi:hypothetical protein